MSKVEDFYPIIEEELKKGNSFSFPINGTSMQPLLHKGDIVTIKKTDTLKKGDIAFFKRDNNTFVLHRIIKIKDSTLDFVGDHQTHVECNIRFDQVIGVVTQYKKKKQKDYKGLNRLSYKIYKFIVKSKIIRFIFSKIC